MKKWEKRKRKDKREERSSPIDRDLEFRGDRTCFLHAACDSRKGGVGDPPT